MYGHVSIESLLIIVVLRSRDDRVVKNSFLFLSVNRNFIKGLVLLLSVRRTSCDESGGWFARAELL